MPPSASFDAFGLHSEVTFLKPALEKVGIGVEAVQISPYKSAPNTFIKDAITPEQQEQMTWLLDDLYDQIQPLLPTAVPSPSSKFKTS
ncbi:MAG: S49 family peptidase [Chloroflexota bacterium]